ncbi:hypothetical protein V4C53_27280 [Paraburkholderia azotifigens]|uniref:hypothetical protein n=1 Tax=Paraburkholderia azotifigens TaxID=2057004 RepID=UPI0004AEA2F7
MKPFDQRYAPGQIHANWFKRGSAIIVLNGTLRLSYRDGSLDWLLGDAPKVSVVLHEGGCHVLPYEAYVEIIATGECAATARIDAGPLSGTIAARIVRWCVSMGRLNGMRVRRS